MTSYGAENPALTAPVESEPSAAVAESDWEHPLTRLMLLLEIADTPTLLSAVSQQAGGETASSSPNSPSSVPSVPGAHAER